MAKGIILGVLMILIGYSSFGQISMGSPVKWYEYLGLFGADSGIISKGDTVVTQKPFYAATTKQNINTTSKYSVNGTSLLVNASPYLAESGYQLKVADDSILLVYNLDTTDVETSPYQKIYAQWLHLNGVPYSSAYLLVNYDNTLGGASNVTLSYVGGNILVVWRYLNGSTSTIYYMYSTNHGATFSTPTPFTETFISNTVIAPYGDCFKIDSGFYQQTFYGGYWAQTIRTADSGKTWSSTPITIFNVTATGQKYDEAWGTAVGKKGDSIIYEVRKDSAGGVALQNSYVQYISTDNGNTYSYAGQMPMMDTVGIGTYQCVGPYIKCDSTRHNLITLVTKRCTNNTNRQGTYGDGLFYYINNVNDVFASPQNWTLQGKMERPRKNYYSFRGYPQLVQINDSSFLGVIEDGISNYTTTSNFQYNLYNFGINYRVGINNNNTYRISGISQYNKNDSANDVKDGLILISIYYDPVSQRYYAAANGKWIFNFNGNGVKDPKYGTVSFDSMGAVTTVAAAVRPYQAFMANSTTAPPSFMNVPIYGSSTFSGDGTTTAFTVTHGLGRTPTQVIIRGTSSAGSGNAYISSKGSTTFVVTFVTAPPSGTNNVTFDWLAQ